MSMTPTAGMAAAKRSGRWLVTAPTNSPRCCRRRWRASRAGETLGDEELGRGDEVVENILFLELGAGFVPMLTVLASTSQIGHGVDPAHLHPSQSGDGEAGLHGNVEPAVAIEECWSIAILLQTPSVSDEHGNSGAVLRVEEDLFNDEFLGLKSTSTCLNTSLSPVSTS